MSVQENKIPNYYKIILSMVYYNMVKKKNRSKKTMKRSKKKMKRSKKTMKRPKKTMKRSNARNIRRTNKYLLLDGGASGNLTTGGLMPHDYTPDEGYERWKRLANKEPWMPTLPSEELAVSPNLMDARLAEGHPEIKEGFVTKTEDTHGNENLEDLCREEKDTINRIRSLWQSSLELSEKLKRDYDEKNKEVEELNEEMNVARKSCNGKADSATKNNKSAADGQPSPTSAPIRPTPVELKSNWRRGRPGGTSSLI